MEEEVKVSIVAGCVRKSNNYRLITVTFSVPVRFYDETYKIELEIPANLVDVETESDKILINDDGPSSPVHCKLAKLDEAHRTINEARHIWNRIHESLGKYVV